MRVAGYVSACKYALNQEECISIGAKCSLYRSLFPSLIFMQYIIGSYFSASKVMLLAVCQALGCNTVALYWYFDLNLICCNVTCTCPIIIDDSRCNYCKNKIVIQYFYEKGALKLEMWKNIEADISILNTFTVNSET